MKPTLKIGEWEVDPIDGHICRGEEIRRLRPKAMGVLVCLAESGDDLVERDAIINRVWGRDLVSDEPLTTCIAELRRGLDDQATSPRYIQTVPKRGYRLVADVRKLGSGNNEEAPVRPGEPTPRLPESAENVAAPGGLFRRPAVLWLALLAGLLALLASWQVFRNPTTSPPAVEPVVIQQQREIPTIAVLPFLNMSSDPETAYFGDGIAEEILNSLTRIEGLRVRSRTSSFALGSQNLAAAVIAERLGVSHILEGSVRRYGDRLRINAQLIDVKADTHVWSEVFEKSAENIFEIQGEIAQRVSESLEVALDLEQQRQLGEAGTTNTGAYQLYLQGRQLLARRTSASITTAVDRFAEALELDPGYARAYLGLADANLLLPQYNDRPGADYLTKALQAVQSALRIKPDLGEAYATLGSVREEMGDFIAAEQAFKTALTRAPRYPTTYHWYGFMLYRMARQEEAQDMLKLAIEQDPLSDLLSYGMAAILVAMGRFDEAETRYRNIIAANPEFSWAYEGLGEMNWNGRGQLQQAAEWYQQAIRYDPDSSYFQALLGAIYLDAARPDEAEQWIDRAKRLQPDSYLSRVHESLLHLYRGEEELAYESALQVLVDDPRNYLGMAITRNHDIARGKLDQARSRYAGAYPELLSPEVQLTVDNFQAAVDLALVLRQTGEAPQAERLLNKAWDIARTYPRHGLPYRLSDVKILALQGKPEQALTLLAQSLDSGWRPYWWFFVTHDPNLETLRANSGFRDLVARIERESH